MQFVLILAVLAALALAQSAPEEPVGDVLGRLTVAGGGVAAVALFAMALSRRIARRLRADFSRHRLLLRRFRSLRRVHLAFWLLITGGISWWLDWGQMVRFDWHLDGSFLIDDLLILTPVLLPLLLSWAAFYEVDRAVRTAMGDDCRPPGGRGRYVAVHVRYYFGVLLAPVIACLAVQDVVKIFFPDVVGIGSEALVFLPLLAILLLLFPLLLRHLWHTRPLPPGPLRSRLEDAARRSGFRARDILLWHTDGMIVNAAVAGVVRPMRYVFLTDALLASLSDEQIEAIFGHELGHVRHRHLPIRVMAMVAPLSLCMLLQQAFPEPIGRIEPWLQAGGLGVQAPITLIALSALAVYAWVAFGCCSRLLEHQADLFGCRLLGSGRQPRPVQTFVAALEQLAAAAGTDRGARGWQHASIARRVDFLNRLGHDPNRELHFHRRVRLLGFLLISIVVSPLAYHLLLG